ncbi:ribonuclease III [Streptococcus pneumoniae GA11663]|nr:ribonuclease III [Streptococcus pneumoniae GA11663]
MTDIAHQLSISTSTVIRKLNDFHFKHDFLVFLRLCLGMSMLLQRER